LKKFYKLTSNKFKCNLKKINKTKKSETDNIESIFQNFKDATSNNNYNEIKLINGFICYIYISKTFGLSMQKRL
jgi:hypothetical protein